MNTVKTDRKCIGCGACASVCVQGAVTVERNARGFYQAVLDEERCISCGCCVQVCLREQEVRCAVPKRVYAGKYHREEIRRTSSSGGIFYALASQALCRDGVVFGAAFDGEFKVSHQMIAGCGELSKLQGSKYVQSDLKNCYQQVKEQLEDGKQVLFSGTPCQAAGLQAFLGKQYDTPQLLAVDLVCHGIPSPAVWKDTVQYYEKKYGGKLEAFSFRDKSRGWHGSKERMVINGKSYEEQAFTELFYRHLMFHPACETCSFSSTERVGDITLGDFWGISRHMPQFDDNLGTSLILVNTEKGAEAIKQIESMLELRETTLEAAMQRPLREPYSKSRYSRAFWNCYLKKGFEKAYARYHCDSFFQKVYKQIKKKRQRKER